MAAKTTSSRPKHCPAARATRRNNRHTARLPHLRLERSGAKHLLTKFETTLCKNATNLSLDKAQSEATPRCLSSPVRRSERQLAYGAQQSTFDLKTVAQAVAQEPTEAVPRRRRRHCTPPAPLKFSLSCEGYSVPAKAICGTNDPDAYWDVARANGDPLIIDLGGIASVNSLTIQGATRGGRHSAWVKKFRLHYQSGTESKMNQVSKWSSMLVLEGNDDATSLRYHSFCDAGGALQTRFIRVIPLETVGGGAMRIALRGSLLDAPPKQYKIPNSSTRRVAYTITEPTDTSQSAAKESQPRYTAGKAGTYANLDVAEAMQEYMGAQLDVELEWSDHSDETQLELPYSPAEVELSLKEYLSSTPALSASSRSGSEWSELPEEMEEWSLVDPLC